MLDAEQLAKMQSPEAPLVQGLMKLQLPGLAQAGYAPAFIDRKSTIEIPDPAAPIPGQRKETLAELCSRIFSVEEARANFDKFALMSSLAMDKAGQILPMTVLDSGLLAIAENAGYGVRFLKNREGNILNGIYLAQSYLKAMITCDNSPGNYIKTIQGAMGENTEDFRLDTPQVLEVLRTYNHACVMFNYLTMPEVTYTLQNAAPKIDLRTEFERMIALVRSGAPVVGLGGFNLSPAVPLNQRLAVEAEMQLGYATFEAIGMRDALNHRRVTRTVNPPPAPPTYTWGKEETEGLKAHGWYAPRVADPFSSAARPYEFVENVKQRLGREVGNVLGLDKLDVGWRTYGAEVLKRAIASNRTVYAEIIAEQVASDNMDAGNPIPFPPGSLVNGSPPVVANIDYSSGPGGTHKRYPDGLVLNGVSLGGEEIAVNMLRNNKKHHKVSDLWGAMFKLYLNPYAKPEEALVTSVDAVADYAREAFDEVLTLKQRKQLVPKISSAVMKVAAQRGMPVSEEIIKRTISSEKTDFGMHKGATGFFTARKEKFAMDFRRGQAEARAENMAPGKKGDTITDQLLGFAKMFYGGK